VDVRTGNHYPLLVQYPEGPRRTLEGALDVPLAGLAKNPAKLSCVVRLRRTTAPVEIHHVDGYRVFGVLLGAEGRALAAVAGDVEKVVREQKLTAGVAVRVLRLAGEGR
jgi:multidrug efflux pump subunit AcrB